jgi:hypothetical protein
MGNQHHTEETIYNEQHRPGLSKPYENSSPSHSEGKDQQCRSGKRELLEAFDGLYVVHEFTVSNLSCQVKGVDGSEYGLPGAANGWRGQTWCQND